MRDYEDKTRHARYVYKPCPQCHGSGMDLAPAPAQKTRVYQTPGQECGHCVQGELHELLDLEEQAEAILDEIHRLNKLLFCVQQDITYGKIVDKVDECREWG